MNTYNISVNGITVFQRIPERKVKDYKERLRNFIFMGSSKTLKDIEERIEVSLNTKDDHCNN